MKKLYEVFKMKTAKEARKQSETAANSKFRSIIEEISMDIEMASERGDTTITTREFDCRTPEDFAVIDRVLEELHNNGYTLGKHTWDTGKLKMIMIVIKW